MRVGGSDVRHLDGHWPRVWVNITRALNGIRKAGFHMLAVHEQGNKSNDDFLRNSLNLDLFSSSLAAVPSNSRQERLTLCSANQGIVGKLFIKLS